MVYELRDYQTVARDFLRNQHRAALFLDMGLGKTLITLDALEPRHLPAIVIAPKRVAESVWPSEVLKWGVNLNLVVAKGDPAARRSVLQDEQADVVVLGRDNIKDLLSITRSRPWATVVFDELSSYRSRGAWWKTAARITADPDLAVWGLTGTPAPNGYLDLWPQIYLLDRGARLGKGISHYRERYFRPSKWIATGQVVDYEPREGSVDAINKKLEDICLSMSTEGRVHLPPLTFNDVTIELPATARKIYRTLSADLIVDLKELLGGEVHTAKNAAALTSKLSQISAGFLFEDPVYIENPRDPDGDLIVANPGAYTWLHDERTNAVKEIVEGTGSPVLVFYRFIPERERLLQVLPQARTINDPGIIDEWNQGRVPVLVAHPASAGHGLNLQHGGFTQVWSSPTWDEEHWGQGIKRTHRSGQEHPVVVHNILANRSIDHLIVASREGKAEIQNGLLAHLESAI